MAIFALQTQGKRRESDDDKPQIIEWSIEPDILSYLWLAIEHDQNIIIVGKNSEVNVSLLSKLASFIPAYNTSLVVGPISAQMNCRFHYVLDSNRKRISNLINVIQNLDSIPDRVLCRELETRNSKEIFSTATIGIPFLTSFNGDTPTFIDRLRTEPYGVEGRDIINIDLIVKLDGTQIESISECRWLARMRIGEQLMQDLSLKPIAKNNKLDYLSLDGSVVLREYSKMNLVGQNTARMELLRRAKFLSRFKGKLSYTRYVLSYREIR